ncbi:hypothetical protein, partial [Klebsiella pneumoniae]|uniref:hypothetical protein n=1 Tax=Klebsiella pneumoniae TaxID=573 RepID=UPI0025A093EC
RKKPETPNSGNDFSSSIFNLRSLHHQSKWRSLLVSSNLNNRVDGENAKKLSEENWNQILKYIVMICQ